MAATGSLRCKTILALGLALGLLPAWSAGATPARERAIEQIPELMGRILESQEEIRERESEIAPVVERYDQRLVETRSRVDAAASEQEAAEALVDYVETYASRLEAQSSALRAIQAPLVRMRVDARELAGAAEVMGGEREAPEDRRAFLQEHFQGVAGATAALAERLERGGDAGTLGDVLHASWASQAALDLPLQELGPEGALSFARQVEGLYARYQARTSQLRAERRAIQRLLDVLIERQLARRLDSIFAGARGVGLAGLLSHDGKSQDWQDLGRVVARTLGLPGQGSDSARTRTSQGRLEYFARGDHRQ
ncbi:MAG: hypothetical protein ABFS46_14310 [Myxococcota bacterium]